VQPAARSRHRPVLVALLLAVLVFYWAIDPYDLPGPLFCWFRRLTGWYCPGCGSTRALHAMTHGDARAMMAYNALAPLALVGAFAMAWATPRRVPRWLWAGALVVVLGFGVLRNVFPALAPPR